MNWITFGLVVLGSFFADVCWTLYILKSSERKSLQAAVWSALIIIIGGNVTFEYAHSRPLIYAAALGAFLGTIITIEFDKRQ